MELIILTGLSGSGKSTALKTLEDLNFFILDNIPLSFAIAILKDISLTEKKSISQKIALCLDIRTIVKPIELEVFFKEIALLGFNYKTIFLETSIQALLNRFNLTRRRHPLHKKTLLQSIEDEIIVMENIKENADLIIDTSSLSAKELAKTIENSTNSYSMNELISIHIQTFGFKYGIPIDADMIFDVRILPNPYYIKELKEKTGNDKEVFDYVMSFSESNEFYFKIKDLVSFTIPKYIKDKKRHLTIGIGCSGGRHRSVTIARKLYDDLNSLQNVNIQLIHREEERGNW